VRFREFTPERSTQWAEVGFRARDYFPHRTFYLPKAAPDGRKLATRSGLRPESSQLWQVVVFARPPATDGLPSELFFDDEIFWHRQHYFMPAQVATASMVVDGSRLYTAAHHSDFVQRISRRREFKTRVEARFRGWDRVLMNSILAFAVEQGLTTVCVPTADAAREQTDELRSVQPELFDRVYDRHVRDPYHAARADAWWAIEIGANRERILLGEPRSEAITGAPTICVCHDVERGLGHRQTQPEFVAIADADAGAALDTMLEGERSLGIAATYNVVGSMLGEVRAPLEADGHCIGFHTFDHHVERRSDRVRSKLARSLHLGAIPDGVPARHQLGQCRSVDYRIKGYRPAQSRLGADTDEASLAHHNFEWLASSTRSFGFDEPRVEHGIVKIPIRFDDFPLHRGMAYDEWETRIVEQARGAAFLAFSLHDCYGARWRDHYDELLRRVTEFGTPKTLDQVAAEVILERAA